MREIQEWAAKIHKQGGLVIDTEATGGSFDDEVFEVAVVRAADGEILFDELFRPRRPIAWHSTRVHGYTTKDLKSFPRFSEKWEQFYSVVKDKPLLAFNSAFDKRLLEQSCKRHGIEPPDWEWHCVMDAYKKYTGRKTNTSLANACAEFSVEAGNHKALKDALAAARVLWMMARGYPITEVDNVQSSKVS